MWQHLEYPWIIPKCGYFQMWQHLEYPWILPNVATSYSTKCGNIWSTNGYYQMWLLLTPPNVATFGVPMDITKCGYFLLHQMWQHLEYQWILPNVATSDSTKCGNIWSTLWILPNVATSKCGVPMDIAKCGYCGKIWSTHEYYQMWLLLTPPNVAAFGVLVDVTKYGYFQMWQNLEYPWILPNVATSYSTKCGNIWSRSTHGYYQRSGRDRD